MNYTDDAINRKNSWKCVSYIFFGIALILYIVWIFTSPDVSIYGVFLTNKLFLSIMVALTGIGGVATEIDSQKHGKKQISYIQSIDQKANELKVKFDSYPKEDELILKAEYNDELGKLKDHIKSLEKRILDQKNEGKE